MHISNILVAFMTGAAVVMAAPAPGVNDGLKPRGDCPNGWVKCGVSLLSRCEVLSGWILVSNASLEENVADNEQECNGTSCKFAGTNR